MTDRQQPGRAGRALRFFGLLSLALSALIFAPLPTSAAGQVVEFGGNFQKGTIVVRTRERLLYLVIGRGKALRYVVGVGRAGRQWAGRAVIDGRHFRPNWSAPDAILRDRPNAARFIAGGSPRNPMGEAALTLSGGDYAIHGTNAPFPGAGAISH